MRERFFFYLGITVEVKEMSNKENTELFQFLQNAKSPKNAKEMAEALGIETKEAERELNALLSQGKILRTRRGKYAMPAHVGASAGRIVGLRRGDAFFVPDDGGQDLFIRENERRGAMHGDVVVARKTQQRGNSNGRRINGEVVCVTTRAHETVVGTVMRNNGGGVLVPEDQRLGDIVIHPSALNNVQSRQMAVVRITDYGSEREPVRGEVVRILGEEGTISASIAAIVHEHNLKEGFNQKTLKEAEAIGQTVPKEISDKRENFRDLCTVTIDGNDAKDFDDAISLVKTAKGHTLYVHIADVTHYVRPQSALDKEGYIRATSVYFPNQVLPMLPEALSNGICSLKEGVDRLCLTCAMDLDQSGHTVRYRFARGVIRVDKRVTYEDANALFGNVRGELMDAYRGVWPMMEDMETLAAKLTKLRVKRGALDFDLSEPAYTLDENGQPVDVQPHVRGISNMMIEEFMLLANECAAKYVKERNLPALYRVHEDPDSKRIEAFSLLLKALGQNGFNRKQKITPRTLQDVLHSVAGEPYEMVVNRVMLRTLQKAKYSETPIGHFGLALKDYCHFTSPIRRYPDIVVHRAIIASLEGGLAEKATEKQHAAIPSMAEHTSERERASMLAERSVDDLYGAAYMQGKIGERYKGTISGVMEFGIFVEIMDVIEGMIPIAALGEDVFVYDEVLYRITGRRSGEIYTLGDKIEIVVASVDLSRRRIDFMPYKSEKPVKPGNKNHSGKRRGYASKR